MSDDKRTDSIDDLKLFSLTEVEEVLGVSHRSLLTYVQTGRLKATKSTGKWRITKKDLQDFIEQGRIDRKGKK